MVKIKKLFQFNFILSCVILLVIGCNRSSSTFIANNSSSEESRIGFESKNLPILNKNNLETLMVGRNKIEIEEILGPPEGKSLDGGNGYLWDYRRPIYDESTRQIYDWSLISFKFIGGLCSNINIRLENSPTFILSQDHNVSRTD